MTLTIGSLFSGVGLLERGLEDGSGDLLGYRRALLAALGNAVVRQCAEIAGRRVTEHLTSGK